MTLLTRLPRPYDPERGRDVADLVPALTGDARLLVIGAAGSAPYLARLTEQEAAWLPGALDDPEHAVNAVIAEAQSLSPETARAGLRLAKRRLALLTALMDLGGAWSLTKVTSALTQLADTACHTALRAALLPLLGRGSVAGLTEGDAETGAGLAVLAMGKMGAFELNYSSDIDLICLFDETRVDPRDFGDARALLIKATRRFCAILSDTSADGYVFRTDLRLRPDPSVTPIVVGMDSAEQYYESAGRPWERAALIKARAAAGDRTAGQTFLKHLAPFVWRRHLDFAAIEDAHAIRLAIRSHHAQSRDITLPGHDMKLGRGGIREIEFFTQTQQLITGGRDPELRPRATREALAALAAKGWVPQDLADRLSDHYVFHRTVEHRLQMQRDAQTHDLPQTKGGFDRLAALMDQDTDALQADLHARLTQVHHQIEAFFAPDITTRPPHRADQDTASAPVAHTQWDEARYQETAARWHTYPALRSPRAAGIFDRITPDLRARLAATTHPQDALAAFDGFLAGLPAGVQVFSLFEANPQLVDLIIDIVGTVPRLATYLSRNAGVLDAVIAGPFWTAWPGRATLEAQLRDAMRQEADYEAKLDAVRRWAKEWHFRIGVHHLRGLIEAQGASHQYAELADACLAALLPDVIAQFGRRHGPPPGRGAVVLGMGSLGAGQLTSTSDLDLIVIYDPLEAQMSEGPKPLHPRPYYARLTQALVTALTVPTAEGKLYEVDMRLRPSGTQGPVATSWSSFESYQTESAWLWEHLALTRARAVAGSDTIAQDVAALRAAVLRRRSAPDVLAGLRDMRSRIAAAKAPDGPFDGKIGPGAMQDIELFAQSACLVAGEMRRDIASGLRAAEQLGWIDSVDALHEAYRLHQKVLCVTRLLGVPPPALATTGRGAVDFLLRETKCATLDQLEATLHRLRRSAADTIEAAIAQHEDGP